MAKLSGTTLSNLCRDNFLLVINMANKNTEQKLVALITGTLKKHGEVSVKGLGSFSVKHQKQKQQREKDGRILLKPPSDVIIFTPEK